MCVYIYFCVQPWAQIFKGILLQTLNFTNISSKAEGGNIPENNRLKGTCLLLFHLSVTS